MNCTNIIALIPRSTYFVQQKNYYVIGPKGMDPELVKKINLSLKDLVDKSNPYFIGMKGMGQVAQWHSVEDSVAIYNDEYRTKETVAKSLGIYRME